MSWDYLVASSNYFEVKDQAEFEKWAQVLGVEVEGEDGYCAICCDGGWPHPEDRGAPDLPQQLSAHLADGSVAVLTEFFVTRAAGSGWGVAINSKGERREEGLPDAINEAAKKLGKVDEQRIC